jgi:protein-S-isoprenylcysteine O-methyltransferase Ste14
MRQDRLKEQRVINHPPWWKGARGEWYVVVQGGLFLLVALGSNTCTGLPSWRYPYIRYGAIAGTSLLLLGGILALSGACSLGRNLNVLPRPKENAKLAKTGAYRLVRHPIYSGIILAALGWGLWVHGWLTIGYAILLFIFFDIKSSREEQWLLGKFSGYAAYQKKVRKLIPFVY